MLKKEQAQLELFFLILIVAGYVIASALAVPLGIKNTRYFAVPYRLLVFLVSVVLIFKHITREKIKQVSIWSFLVFWIFYLFKTFYSFHQDLYDPEFMTSGYEVYYRILLIVVFPSLALMLMDYSKINFKKVAEIIFYIFFVMLSLNLLYALGTYRGKGTFFLRIFAIYYISAGHLGASLSIISMYFLLFEKNLSQGKKWLFRIGFILGITSIVLITARSPFLALAVVSFYLILVSRRKKLILLYVLALVIAVLAIYIFGKGNEDGSQFVTRAYRWIFEGDNSLRTPYFERSIEIFKEHPIFGGRILYEDGMYPHDIFLELAMATGLVGIILYFLKFMPVLKTVTLYCSSKQNPYFILFFALFLQYFVLVITSCNLFSAPEFVHFSSMVIGISICYLDEKA